MPAAAQMMDGPQEMSTFQFGNVRALAVCMVNDDGSMPSGIGSMSGYPAGAVPVNATSGTMANATASATLPAAVGKRTYITGFTITGGGALTASLVNAALAGVMNGPLGYAYGGLAGVLALNAPLSVTFPMPLPGAALNTAITMSLPALGAGNTSATVVLYGFQL